MWLSGGSALGAVRLLAQHKDTAMLSASLGLGWAGIGEINTTPPADAADTRRNLETKVVCIPDQGVMFCRRWSESIGGRWQTSPAGWARNERRMVRKAAMQLDRAAHKA